MKIKHLIILISIGLFLITLPISILGQQSRARITNVDFNQEGQTLVITYNIINHKAGEKFDVWVKIRTVSGREITPYALSGDVGRGISGGYGKRIVWDMANDNVEIVEEGTVEILAKSTYMAVVKPPKDKSNRRSVGAALGLSLIWPGAGTTYAKKGGAYWLFGMVGYGLVAGSIVMNNSASKAYDNYLVETDSEERQNYYDKADSQDKNSKYLIYGAAGVWAINLIWSAAAAASENKKYIGTSVMVYPQYDPVYKTAMVTMRFKL